MGRMHLGSGFELQSEHGRVARVEGGFVEDFEAEQVRLAVRAGDLLMVVCLSKCMSAAYLDKLVDDADCGDVFWGKGFEGGGDGAAGGGVPGHEMVVASGQCARTG